MVRVEQERRVERARRDVVGRHDVEEPLGGELQRRDVSRVRAAHDQVGSAAEDGQPVGARGARRLGRGRELGDRHPRLHRLLDVPDRRVVVAREREGPSLAETEDRGAVPVAVLLLSLAPPGDERVELRVGEPELASVVLAVLGEAGELALPGRVVHERHEPDQGVLRVRREVVHDVLRGHLAPHV